MGLKHGVVVVSQSHDVRKTLGSWFSRAGYEVWPASSFGEARSLMARGPDMLVTDLKLGEYNGLHLAAHAHSLGIPAIVIGPSDIGLERDAENLGALYLSQVRKQDLLDVVAHELATHHFEHPSEASVQFLPLRRRMMEFPLPGRSLLEN